MTISQAHTFTSCTFEDLFEVTETIEVIAENSAPFEPILSDYFEVRA